MRLDRVDAEIRTIWNFYDTLETYQENKDKLEEKTLKDFANNIISHHGSSIKSRLDNLHSLVIPKGGILDNEGVISMFAKGLDVRIFIKFLKDL